jgi:hypothetical protein
MNWLRIILMLAGTGLTGLAPSAVWADTATVAWTHDGVQTTEYKIQRRAGGGAYSLVGTVPASARSWPDPTTLGPGEYCWQVQPFNGATPGPVSSAGCATVGGAAPPTAPTTITITIVGPTATAPPGVRLGPPPTGQLPPRR